MLIMFARVRRAARRPSRQLRLAAATAALAALVAASAAVALPAGVTALKGTSLKLPVELQYAAATRSVNGFTVNYTCRGRKPVNDSDVYTIADRGNGSRALTRARVNGQIRTTLTGRISRHSEDGPRTIGTGKLTLNARAYAQGSRRIIRGTMRVRSGTCPSASTLRLYVNGRR
ncbi:MAG: hypothetical protein Q8O56_05610 [Solirubrobacteraceae bacterium]|nr:hypothetical protein [Solirubrobacteraceae bacterium]